MLHKPFTLLIHIALAIILAGAIVTHFLGVQGQLSLTEDSGPASEFEKTSGPSDARLPFSVTLLSADIDFYPGTTTPMDFRSHLLIDSKPVTVSMNNVAEIDGWRFYQSGISPGATRLSVSHDPWGTGITYTGYALLFIGMAGFFFQRNTLWRAVLRQGRRAVAAVGIMSAFGAGRRHRHRHRHRCRRCNVRWQQTWAKPMSIGTTVSVRYRQWPGISPANSTVPIPTEG